MLSVLSLAVLGAGIAGCETKAGTGALVGGAAGAGIGAIVGNNSHGRTASGAAIGGAVGAIGGALIGNEMDKKDREAARQREYDDYHSGRDRHYRSSSDGVGGYDDADPYAPRRRSNPTYESRATGVSKEDVIEWTRRGDRDEQIVDRIDRSGTTFNLSSRDENRLRDNGVSEEVIRAMKDTARR
jgi:surface antigen